MGLFFAGLLLLSLGLQGGCSSECRYDIDCQEDALCTEGKCVAKEKPKPNPTEGECVEGERRACFEGGEGLRGIGNCKDGFQICIKEIWSKCQDQILPTEEICDGKDNDCDGQIDKGCDCLNGQKQRCYTGDVSTRNKGVCQDGEQTCIEGKWGPCQDQKLPQAELCDNADNDCNGQIDDGVKRPCSSPCGPGEEICKQGQWEACSARQPTPEKCGDQIDNNCDGGVDEGCDCKPGEERSCYSGPQDTQGKGPCIAGKQTCNPLGKWETCVGQVTPKVEDCNKQDDDCNGSIDDGLTRACQRGCNAGKETCVSGQWKACDASPAEAEICDGKDNDCNGKVDDVVGGCECLIGQQESCYDGPPLTMSKGICKQGSRTCQTTGRWSLCTGQVTPSAEVCDGQDNDCDGQADNEPNTTQALSKLCYDGPQGTAGNGICRQGSQTCQAGRWGACQGQIVPSTETCNNQDEDCDGKIDEALIEDCYSGAAGTAGVGLCLKGRRTCQRGIWGACQGEVTPTAELCDQKDNNCNGQVDEQGACDVCQAGQTQACYTGPASTRGHAPCKDGTQSCSAGQWGACTGEVKPKTEACNGQDDDCDGRTDEGLTRACTSACGQGIEICTAGQWGSCDAPAPKTETCNGQDDDCDGKVDEGLDCSLLATGDWSGNVYLWNPASTQRVGTFANSSAVYSMRFSPNRLLLGVGRVGALSLWNPETKLKIRDITTTGTIRSVDFSAASDRVATGSSNRDAIVWSTSTGSATRTLTGFPATVTGVRFAKLTADLITASDTQVRFWTIATGAQNTAKAITIAAGNYITSMDLSSDGKTLAIGYYNTTTISIAAYELWDISATPRLLRKVTVPDYLYSIAFSADGKKLSAACVGYALVWDLTNLASPAETARLRFTHANGYWIYAAEIAPDGKTLGVGGRTGLDTKGHLYLYDLSPATPAQTFFNTDHPQYLWTLTFRR